MKKGMILIGALFTLMGLVQGGRYWLNYNSLTAYDQGYIFGSILLLIIGIMLIITGIRKT